MSSRTPSCDMTDDFPILPASAMAAITDEAIAVLSRFLVRSTNKQGRLPLEYPRRCLDDNKNKAIGITHAPLSGKDGFERSRKVLDALVAISVCGGTQCLALSVSFGAKVCITIAQNDEPPPTTISKHLHNVWSQLRTLADVQRNIRRESDELDLRGKSPKSAEHLRAPQLKSLKEKLYADVHQHCYMKSKQRIIKYLGPCAEFQKFYRRTRNIYDPDLAIANIVFHLVTISEMVTGYKGAFDACGAPADMNWSDLAKKSSLLLQTYLKNTTKVKKAISNVMTAWRTLSEVKGESCIPALTAWRTLSEVKGESCIPALTAWRTLSEVKDNLDWRRFDLMRGLEKAVTLTRHLQELVNFAYSPRLRSFLERELDVRLLRPPNVEFPDPSDEDMRAIVEQAFNATLFARTRRIDEEDQLQNMRTDQLGMVHDTILPSVSKHTVHAEYTLLLHHHCETRHPANPPPFQYIAVNKLACFSCWSGYKGYTEITGRIFSLRGSHSKLYFPGCATTGQFDDALGTAMRTYLYWQLVALYSEHLNHIEDNRNRMADSTVASHVSEIDHRLQIDSDDEDAATRDREADDARVGL